MNTEDCKNTASFIFEDFYFLTIADLKLISKSLRSRKFIRVTGNEIYREVEIYFNKRCEFASDYSKKESDDNKTLSVGSEVLNDKELKQYYKDVKDGKKLSEAPKDIERNCNKIDRKHKEFRERYEDEN